MLHETYLPVDIITFAVNGFYILFVMQKRYFFDNSHIEH